MSANDDEVLDWIGPVKELIRDAVTEGVPTLGICLGHQLIGAALGGRVTPNPRGQQVGLIPVGWTDAAAGDRLFGGLATPRRGVQWNYDLLVEPPAEAVVLAQTPDGEVQVARFGPSAWGVQLHPEVDETDRRHLGHRLRAGRARGPRPRRGRAARRDQGGPGGAGPRVGAAGRGLRRRGAGTGVPEPGALTMPDTRPSTTKGHLTRLGFQDPEHSLDNLDAIAGAAEPLLALVARTADPDLALASLVRLVEAAREQLGQAEAEQLLQALVDDEGTAMRLLSVLGASEALADHLCRHPEHWRELTDPDDGLDPPRGVRRPGGPAARGGADPTTTSRRDAPTRGRGRAARRVPPAPAPPGLPRPDPPPRGRRRRRRALRPRGRHPRRGPGHRPAAGRRDGPTWPGSPSSRWASAAATSSTTSPTST